MSVYVNRLLNLKRIKVVGFDMDYTLVGYDIAAFEGLTHSLACGRLVSDYGYPAAVKDFRFDVNRAIVGLVIDKTNGNLLKLSRFGKVKLAWHGLEEIDFRTRSELYRQRAIDIGDPDFQTLDTAFAISNGVLYGQLVQLKKDRAARGDASPRGNPSSRGRSAGGSLPDYRVMAAQVNEAIDSLHKDGTLKTILKADFDKYVIRDPKTAKMLERMKAYGKKLMIITNSDYDYTRALMDYALPPEDFDDHNDWREVFDLVITFADKPRFFEGRHRFLKIDPETGTMTNHEGPVSEGLWQGGWFRDVQEGLDVEGDEFLYLGDHIYGDVVSIKKRCDWRTALVLGGLDDEIAAIRETRDIQLEIDRLMDRKAWLERKADEAELKRRAGGKARLSEEQIAEQDRLNEQVSELLEKLKPHFNPFWGEILRAGSEESRYAEQVEKYACIYMTRVSDLYKYSPRTYFRPPRRKLAHELAED